CTTWRHGCKPFWQAACAAVCWTTVRRCRRGETGAARGRASLARRPPLRCFSLRVRGTTRMLSSFERALFFLLAVGTLGLAWVTFRWMLRSIERGEGRLHFDDLPRRAFRAVEVALTQRTVLRARPATSVMHLFVAWGF